MNNTIYKTRLASEKGKFDCPGAICTARNRKNTYSRVIEVATGTFLPYAFGRCDKPSCGYEHLPTKDDLLDLGILGSYSTRKRYDDSLKFRKEQTEPQPSYLMHDYASIKNTLATDLYEHNQLAQAIFRLTACPWEWLVKVFADYGVGTATKGPFKGAPIFYRYDADKNIYPGQIVPYDKRAKRRKKGRYTISNSSIALDKTAKTSKPLFFGTHLIHDPITRKIGLVESPKTALIAAIYEPTFIWIATGGLQAFAPTENGKQRMLPLKKHPIIVFPDADAYQDRIKDGAKPQKGWITMAEEWKTLGYSISLSTKVLNYARLNKNRQKVDLADLLLEDPIA